MLFNLLRNGKKKGEVKLDFSFLWTAGIFVHLALLCYILGFLVRDELILRSFVICGSSFYIAYYYLFPQTPLWDAIFASGVIVVVNIVMVFVIVRERSTFGMSKEDIALFSAFSTLKPGQFRRIMKQATWGVAQADEMLCAQGKPLDKLFFVLEGGLVLHRNDRVVNVPASKFIGEISFLLERNATATVSVEKGAKYVSWEQVRLRKLMRRQPNLSNALTALFNQDLARKLAESMPD